MRSCFFPLIFALAACATNTSSGPGKLPDDARGAMYTLVPIDQVARCMVRAIGGRLTNDGTVQVVTSPLQNPSTYSIGPNEKYDVYPTQVVIRGDYPNDAERAKAALCL